MINKIKQYLFYRNKDYTKLFCKIFKNHNDKTLNGIKHGQCIKNSKNEICILFYCDECFNYNDLPSAYRKDWYFFNLKTKNIERVHPYNNFILKENNE